ncbi:MAG: penicillin-insensitive murein endopeptidase [Polyangiales bacterium]
MRALPPLLALCLLAGIAAAADNPWPSFTTPAPGPARALGDYSAGCLQGAEALPIDGPGFRVMRPSRARFWGHPTLIAYVRGLGRRVQAKKSLGAVLVGDLSQPRGGRAQGGHASHQIGLDVDLWYTRPRAALPPKLAPALREVIGATSVVDEARGTLRAADRARVTALLALAADDPRVDRIFVNPLIKRALCSGRARDGAMLRKLRPWYGHDEHFHVRLACPADEPDCQAQPPFPPDDGCDKLAWWFDARAQAARKEARASYRETISEGKGWPAACETLLHAP